MLKNRPKFYILFSLPLPALHYFVIIIGKNFTLFDYKMCLD